MRKPAGRGKIERFFRTVRQQFLAPLDTDQLAGIADGVLYELPSTLIGERVVLRYDPTLPPSNRRLFVHHGGRHVGEARLVDSYANARVRRADLRLDPAADDDNRLQDD